MCDPSRDEGWNPRGPNVWEREQKLRNPRSASPLVLKPSSGGQPKRRWRAPPRSGSLGRAVADSYSKESTFDEVVHESVPPAALPATGLLPRQHPPVGRAADGSWARDL